MIWQLSYHRGMSKTLTLYHGTYTSELALHKGLCLTDDWTAAKRYADQYAGIEGDTPSVHTVEVDMTGLNVVDLGETWRSEPETAAQDAARFADAAHDHDADVIVYGDYALGVGRMTTWRLLTDRALDAVTIVDAEEV